MSDREAVSRRWTACWITKNESANIGRSIESVRDAADELIVVDTGSSDDTVSVAESLGARVEHFEWIGDFSAARNYALSLASGGVIIFLDADEWFEPKLGQAERAAIEGVFAKNRRTEIILSQINNLSQTGGLSRNSPYASSGESNEKNEKNGKSDKEPGAASTNIVSRIFLNKKDTRYLGKIHEYLRPADKNAYTFLPSPSISHSGYLRDVAAVKLARNIALLEAGLADPSVTGDDRVRFLVYLVREHHNRGEFEKASGYLAEILRNPGALERLCAFHSQAFIPILYPVMWTAYRARGSVSRRGVRQNLFSVFKKAYQGYPGAVEIDLLYQALFDMKEDRFLREFEPAARAVAAMNPNPVISYIENGRFLYEKAAVAAWRRRDSRRAMEYAASALKGGGKYRQWLLYILLNAAKGQPPRKVVSILDGVFNTSEPGDLDFLIRGTCIDGCLPIHAHYVGKRVNSPDAYIRDYMHFILIRGEYGKLAATALEAHAAGDMDAPRYLFLAAVCGAPRDAVEPSAHILDECSRAVLSAYYDRQRLADAFWQVWQAGQAADLLRETYPTVAFAAGMEAADRYLDVFMADPRLCFSVKAAYCEISDLPEHLLKMRGETGKPGLGAPGSDVSGSSAPGFDLRFVRAMAATGRYGEAVDEIEKFLSLGGEEPEVLHILLAISEAAKAAQVTKKSDNSWVRARMLYDRYDGMQDLMTDLADVIGTGIVFDDGGKKQNQFFRSMTKAQFDKYLTDESARPASGRLLTLCRKAAGVYMQCGLPAEAARCLWRLAAHGSAEKEIYAELAEIFTALKNPALAEYIRTLAQ